MSVYIMREKNIIELRDVWKEYVMGKEVVVKALRGVNLGIKRGDYVSILGPSGSGKSTLLHMLGLLDVPTKGEVVIDGIKTSSMSDDERAYVRGHKIGFVFQTFNLIPSLSALENVALPLMIDGVPLDKRLARAEELLRQLGMGNRIHHKPMELSGGQRQRVAIARALVQDPPIILADEPTGNLDSKTGDEVVKIFDELNKRGKTLVIVTHDSYVAKHAKRILHIRDGNIVKVKE